jgi:LysM repeat protein
VQQNRDNTPDKSSSKPIWRSHRLPGLLLIAALTIGVSSSAQAIAPVRGAQPVAALTADIHTPPPAQPAPTPTKAASVARPAPATPKTAAQDPSIARNAYTIVAGDTVSAVAARYGADLDVMLAANGLSIHSPISPGQVLKFTGPPVPAKEPAVKTSRPATAAGRVITLGGAGGQAMVDRCIGPIHFTPVTESYSIAEHDFCGGWARFSGIQVGETVTVPGLGTYTVTGRGNVPNPGTMSNVTAVLGRTPPAFLQTCIPGTSMMLVIGLG